MSDSCGRRFRIAAFAVAALAVNGAAIAQGLPRPDPVTCWDGSPAPSQEACPQRTVEPFVIFFDHDSAAITANTARILDNVAQVYQLMGPYRMSLSGHADRSGAETYNQRLSQRRLDSVQAYLVRRGVPTAAISGEALGETRLLVDTPDGVREPQNRFVVIAAEPLSSQ